MTIAAVTPRAVYTGNSSATVFPIIDGSTEIPFLADDEIVVAERSLLGDITILDQDTHYTIDRTEDSGVYTGSITRINLGVPYAIATGVKLAVFRYTTRSQELGLVDTGDFSSETIEQALDRITRISQELDDGVTRALKKDLFNVAYDAGGVRLTGLANATDETDAVTYAQLASAVMGDIEFTAGAITYSPVPPLTSTNVQDALGEIVGLFGDPLIASIAGLTFGADSFIYGTGTDTAAAGTITSVARTLVAQSTQALMRTAGLGMSANGSSLVAAADYAAMRALLDLEPGVDFYSIAAANAAFQPLDSDLTSWAGVTRASGFDTFAATPSIANFMALLTDDASGLGTFLTTPSSANLRSLLTDETGSGLAVFNDAPTLIAPVLGVATATSVSVGDDAYAVGWNGSTLVPTKNAVYDKIELILTTTLPGAYQPLDASLTAYAALTTAADQFVYYSAADTPVAASFTSVARTLVAQTTQALMRTTGLGMSANGSSLVSAADYAAMRALLDLEAGTDFYSIAAANAAFQPLDADLTSWAGVTRASGFDTFAATPSLANLGSLLTDDATGLITFMTTPSSANLRALLTDEVGTGAAYFVGGALGTPASGTGTNLTGIPLTGLVSDTTTALGIGSINLGHASDTTLARVSAGVVSIAGVNILTTATGQPLDSDLTSWAAITRASGFDTFTATPSIANLMSLLTDDASGLGTFMTTPSSANLRSLLTDETGSGAAVFGTAPTISGLLMTGTADVQQALLLSGDITPTQLAANTNDWAPTNFATSSVIRVSTDAARDITGLAGGSDGRCIFIYNVGSFNAVLKNESVSSSAANRFSFGADLTLGSKQGAFLIYDAVASLWRCVGSSSGSGGGGGSGTVTQVNTGTGLTGGPITTSGTIQVDANLGAISGLTSAADKGIMFTGSGAAATYDLSAYALTLLDDTTAAAARTTLGFTSPVIDRAYAEYTTYTALSTTIPLDDTIPTSSEGTQVLSVSITPKSATNRLRATFVGNAGTSSTGTTAIAALFDGTTCKDTCSYYQTTSATGGTIGMCVEWVPGDTSSHTISVRVGASSGNAFLNGSFSARLFGGAARATLVVEELAV